MSTGTPKRTCGSCGGPVDASAVTCPRCGALLAAYEAPRGSAPVSEMTTQTPVKPVAPRPLHRQTPDQPVARSTTTPEASPAQAITASPPRGASSQASTTTPREPRPAATAARTDLASVLNNRQETLQASHTSSRTDLVSVLKSRGVAMMPSPSTPTRSPSRRREEARSQPTPTRETGVRQHVAQARQMSTREIASTAGSVGKLALGVLMILVFLGILDFDLIPILVLGVVMLSLLGIMRSAAKASGRKTTTMHDPKRRDSWRR